MYLFFWPELNTRGRGGRGYLVVDRASRPKRSATPAARTVLGLGWRRWCTQDTPGSALLGSATGRSFWRMGAKSGKRLGRNVWVCLAVAGRTASTSAKRVKRGRAAATSTGQATSGARTGSGATAESGQPHCAPSAQNNTATLRPRSGKVSLNYR